MFSLTGQTGRRIIACEGGEIAVIFFFFNFSCFLLLKMAGSENSLTISLKLEIIIKMSIDTDPAQFFLKIQTFRKYIYANLFWFLRA